MWINAFESSVFLWPFVFPWLVSSRIHLHRFRHHFVHFHALSSHYETRLYAFVRSFDLSFVTFIPFACFHLVPLAFFAFNRPSFLSSHMGSTYRFHFLGFWIVGLCFSLRSFHPLSLAGFIGCLISSRCHSARHHFCIRGWVSIHFGFKAGFGGVWLLLSTAGLFRLFGNSSSSWAFHSSAYFFGGLNCLSYRTFKSLHYSVLSPAFIYRFNSRPIDLL